MIKLIAFDLDGTIGETIPMCIKAFKQAVSPYAGHVLSEREIVQTFGLNEEGMIKMVAGEKWQEALHDFYPIYERMHEECPKPYEDICELIKTLRAAGILVALITGKGEKSCMITLEKFGMQNLFCSIKTGSEDKPNKADAITELLHFYQLNEEEFCYVGRHGLRCRRMQNRGRNLPVRCLECRRRRCRLERGQPFQGIFQCQRPVAFFVLNAG